MFKPKKRAQALSGAIQAYNRVSGEKVTYQRAVADISSPYELNRLIRSLKNMAAFNRKMGGVSLSNKITFSYSDIVRDIGDSKTVNQFNKRLERFLRPGAEKVVRLNSNLEATVWEVKEIEYARRAANKNRAELQKEYRARKSSHGIQYNKWRYAPFTVTAKSMATRRDLKEYLSSYIREARPGYSDEEFMRYRMNLVKSINWMMEYGVYDELVDLFMAASRDKIMDAVTDSYSPLGISFNYPSKGIEEEAKIIYAEMIAERWKRRLM